MKYIQYIKYIIPVSFLFLIISCTDNAFGIFYSIQYESEVTNGNLNDELTVGGMVSETIGSNVYYFAAAGDFMYKSDSATEWTVANPVSLQGDDGELNGYLCFKVELLDSIYAIYYDADTIVHRLFKADTSSIAESGISWTEIDISGYFSDLRNDSSNISVNLVDIMQCNNRTFLYVQTEYTNSISDDTDTLFYVYSTTETSLTSSTSLTLELSGLKAYGDFDVDYDGSNYWLVAGRLLYRGISGSWTEITESSFPTTAQDNIDGYGYGGIICVGSDVYLSTEEGVLLKYSSGSWTDLTSEDLLNPLYDFKRATFNYTNSNVDVLLLGASEGYYVLNLADSSATFCLPTKDTDELTTTALQYESIDLRNTVVTDFYVNDSTKTIFALCFTGGLWVNTEKSWSLE